MKSRLVLAAGVATSLLLTACGGSTGDTAADPTSSAPADNSDTTITMWVVGGDTPEELRTYLKDTFAEETGATLNIEEQSWGDIVTKLTTSLPDPNNTPDVTELGNTQSPTFTNVGAFLDISDIYPELGGEKLLQSFVDVGSVDGKQYALPYYFGSRYMFYRKDLWQEAGVPMPTTLEEFNSAVTQIAEENPRAIEDFSGLFLGGQDWRNGISWIFANGGELATESDGEWTSTLSDPNTLEGLAQLQEIYRSASNAPADAKDAAPWLYINDSDEIVDESGEVTGTTGLSAATIMAPGWARWSIGDLTTNDEGAKVREWNDETFGVFPLPGNDGEPAPVFAGGSNLAISAASQHPDLAKDLLRIIYSEEYQTMLGENGLGPANSDYVSALGSDQFAQATIDSASNSKLTPAAPGWAAVEAQGLMEEFFGKIRDAEDLEALAAEYDARITPVLNAQ